MKQYIYDDNCTKIMNRFFELDKNEHIPFTVTLHLLTCKKCRTAVRLMSQAEKAATAPLKISVPLGDASVEAVLKEIDPSFNTEKMKSPITLGRWIFSGLLMVGLLLVFGMITNHFSSTELMISFYLMFAGLVTVYCALFIGCNMDFFVKQIEAFKFRPYEHTGFQIH